MTILTEIAVFVCLIAIVYQLQRIEKAIRKPS